MFVLCKLTARTAEGLVACVSGRVLAEACSRSGNLKGAPKEPFNVREPGTVRLLDVLDEEDVDGTVFKEGRLRI